MRLDDRLEALAPHVEAHWREKFMTEASLRGASAPAISDALVEVETHCRESGRSTEPAFGSAAGYARNLGLPAEARWSRTQLLATFAKILLPVLGVWAIFLGASPDASGQRSDVSAGLVLSAAMFITVMAIVARFARKVLRVFVDHPVWSTVGFMVVVTVIALIGVPFNDAILSSVPAAPTLAIGVAAIAISIVWNVLAIRAGTNRDDPLAPPRLRPDTGDRR